jgi:hypothetical protein
VAAFACGELATGYYMTAFQAERSIVVAITVGKGS